MNCICKGRYNLPEPYVVGENRPITIQVTDSEADIFTITEALYQVVDKNRNVTAAGACVIDNEKHTVTFMFNPHEAGTYTIEFEITVPPVVRIIDLVARVREQAEVS
ncbi:MAG: hypothetical protein K6G90_03125 [Clostridia bacterium]|nr:hypothetical protein [Clostridia bacterium]